MSDTEYAEAQYINDKNSPKLSRAPQGRRLGDERLEVLVVLVALSELPRVGRNWAAVEYPQEEKVEERQEWVHNLYSTSITQTMRL